MLLLIFAGFWVLVLEDKVNLVGGTALVGTKHDHVGRGIREFLGVKGLVLLKELHVGTSTFETIWEKVSASVPSTT